MAKVGHCAAIFVAAAVIAAVLSAAGCGPSPKLFAQRMNSGDAAVRRAAAKELRVQPKHKAKLVPVILQACRDPDLDVRVYGYYAIGLADPREEGVVGAILEGMADTSAEVRRAVASSLGVLDPFPNTCVPYMVKLLVDPDERTRKLVFSALADLESGSIGSLIRNIDAKDDTLRLAVIGVLAQIGEPAKSALPRLRQIAREDGNDEIRAAAEKAVKFIER
jgi:HEAT repeat protein